MVENNFLESIKDICVEWPIEPFLYYNREKFFQTYEISKQFDFDYITPFNYRGPNFFRQSARPPENKTAYLSIFCPVSDKGIHLLV